VTTSTVHLPESPSRARLAGLLSRDELARFTARSDWMGAWAIGSTWAVIAGAFWLMAWGSQRSLAVAAVSFAVGLCVLAGRQLCLAILMHDASHRSLFERAWLNDTLGDWLCARPIWNDLRKYRVHHAAHHARTGSSADPDLSLVAPFPCTRGSLARKLLRDLSGLTGLKFLLGRLLMDAGYIRWTVANDVVWLPARPLSARLALLARNTAPTLLVNALLAAGLGAAGHTWLYGAWLLAYVTPFALFLRIRSLAEHACTAPTSDPFENTRTTRAGLLARATVAPLRVNYHIEHHALASVPYFRLPALHRLLVARGALPEAPSYLDVLRLVSAGRPRT
jgi:fatty acid desaturase